MDELTLGAITLPATLVALAAALVMGAHLELAPRLAHRRAVRDLRADVQHLVDEHAARPAPRRRHAHHCPACGRFARVTSSGPRGTWTRCAAHGLRLRAIRRIGRAETPLVGIRLHRPIVPLPIVPHTPLVPMLEAMRPTVRLPDWLDGVPTSTLRRALAA